MKQIELTEDQVGLVKICLQAEELLNFFREAEEIVLRFNDAAVPA
jgi:hypothetical protein